MNTKRSLLILLLAAGLAIFSISAARAAPPPIPCKVYGSIRVDGQNVAEGTLVSAWINGVPYAESATYFYNGVSTYTLTVPGDDLTTPVTEGGRAGDTIHFHVGAFTASQTATWQGSSTARLQDLTFYTSNPDAQAFFPLILGNSLP